MCRAAKSFLSHATCAGPKVLVHGLTVVYPSLDTFFATLQLPSMDEVSRALIETLHRNTVSLREVSTIISKDPALSAKLLQLANSAQFGLPRGIGTLDDAIAIAGMDRVRALALGVNLSGAFPQTPALPRRMFWQYSMTCAGYAQWLGNALAIDPQTAWLSGMMLRLGELLIAQTLPGEIAAIEQQPCLPGERWQRERIQVGFSEGQLSAELARRWNFPMQMSQALQRACNPLQEQAFSRLGSVLHLAGLLADFGADEAAPGERLPIDVVDSLKLDVLWLQDHLPPRDQFIDVSSL